MNFDLCYMIVMSRHCERRCQECDIMHYYLFISVKEMEKKIWYKKPQF